MTFVVADRVKDTTTTTGTGTVTLANSAPTGFQTFGSVCANLDVVYYCIAGGAEWEVGYGTYTVSGTTLSRDVVLASSNSGSLVSFSAGTKDVFLDAPAKQMPYNLYEFAVGDLFNFAHGLGTGNTSTSPSSTSAAASDALAVYMPFTLQRPRKISALTTRCDGANNTGVVRLGIYADSGGRPGAVTVDAGTASITATGVKTLSGLSTILQPGHYWTVLVAQSLNSGSGNPTFTAVGATLASAGDTAIQTSNFFAYLTSTGISGALANNPTITLARSGAPIKAFMVWGTLA